KAFNPKGALINRFQWGNRSAILGSRFHNENCWIIAAKGRSYDNYVKEFMIGYLRRILPINNDFSLSFVRVVHELSV
ncbi:MAG: hypothetical protein ACXWTS_07735, partial [Methylococcaceae bacterium]